MLKKKLNLSGVRNWIEEEKHDKNIQFTIGKAQEIPADFVSNLKKLKADSMGHREGDFMRVASVPTIVHEQWLKEGFDMMKEDPKAILKRLRDQHLDAFITTNKKV